MFTGIVEEVGIIKEFKRNSNGADIVISCDKVLEESKIGDSIAVNGVCQTVVSMDKTSFKTNLSQETLDVTTFSELNVGENVNLERALQLSSRLGGHIVSGHVDCVGKVLKLEPFTFELSKDFSKYIVKKGSVTVNGVSLTVKSIENNVFDVAIIPHTLANTSFVSIKVGDSVNIETDIFAKYIENFFKKEDNKTKISSEFLIENGFI